MDKRYFSDKIVKWYIINKRSLPWRKTKHPYTIWLSEIILQQTRVIQGLPYYERFVSQYPTVEQLAKAPEQDVLRLWQGLGYYTRARNLHKCAKAVVELHQGKFPSTFQTLLALPGIGDYTAAAIASIAFKEPVAVVDGNVFRVLSRVFGIETAINSPEGKKQFTTLANELISEKNPDVHNQAVMEFGALFCTPKNPMCEACPLQAGCFAFKHNMQAQLPVKIKSKAARKRFFYYVVIEKGKNLRMRRRETKDIWFGLFDFPLIESIKSLKMEKILQQPEMKNIVAKAKKVTVSQSYKHILTHQTIVAQFIIIEAGSLYKESDKLFKFYSMKEIAALPKPVLVSRFLADQYLLQ